jgi:hypothetical protein
MHKETKEYRIINVIWAQRRVWPRYEHTELEHNKIRENAHLKERKTSDISASCPPNKRNYELGRIES